MTYMFITLSSHICIGSLKKLTKNLQYYCYVGTLGVYYL